MMMLLYIQYRIAYTYIYIPNIVRAYLLQSFALTIKQFNGCIEGGLISHRIPSFSRWQVVVAAVLA